MANQLDKRRERDAALDTERRKMNEALTRLNGINAVRRAPRNPARLMIGLDLTGSREPRLKEARIAMAGMLDVMKRVGGFTVKAVYYRGTNECRETAGWTDDIDGLCRSMMQLSCEVGGSQIGRVLQRALDEKEQLDAVIFIGDHCEEDPGELKDLAAALGRRRIPVFVFHECSDFDKYSRQAKPVFKFTAEASGGAYVEFKPDSGAALKEMLASIAAFSAQGIAGVKLLAAPQTAPARQLREGLRLMLGSGTTKGGC